MRNGRVITSDMTEARFPLGGIGTGNVSLGSRGQLCDWEIFNTQGIGQKLKYTFFALYVRQQNGTSFASVLESRARPPYLADAMYLSEGLYGLPRFAECETYVEYPFVTVRYIDETLPVDVTLTAFTPFIPLNADDSGIPGFVLRYTLKNRTAEPVHASLAGSLLNATAYRSLCPNDETLSGYLLPSPRVKNEYIEEDGLRGIHMSPEQPLAGRVNDGTMALCTRAERISYRTSWLEGGWWDGITDFWDDFRADGHLEPPLTYRSLSEVSFIHDRFQMCSLCIEGELQPGESRDYEFLVTWCFPNRVRAWSSPDPSADPPQETVRNHYAARFPTAWSAAAYLADQLPRLEGLSRSFAKAFYGSTVPREIIDTASSGIAVLRSTTCFWLEDGSFLGWEGSWFRSGSCYGSCTHVWGYAQTLGFLFPELEQSMLEIAFLLETDDAGCMAFRTRQVFGQPRMDFHPAADGQLACVVRAYRQWKLTGDTDALRRIWDKVKLTLDFAFDCWDSDGDFVLDSQQHNTYDIEFYGPNAMTNTVFLAALRAASAMALAMGEPDTARRYREASEQSAKHMDEMLWNGEYYVQRIDDVNAHRYQIGEGCLSDQLVGQYLAYVAGLGDLLPREHIESALMAVYRHNFVRDFTAFEHVQRVFALGDERGLVLCSWPRGGRPRLPMVYADEVWTGIEHQVAATLLHLGRTEEGLELIRAVRDRYDGHARNPWSEFEWGHRYVRSMASYASYLAWCGFSYDIPNGLVSFSPRAAGNFACFFCHGKAWGIYRRQDGDETWEILYDVDRQGGLI